jgi:hypothetical protein
MGFLGEVVGARRFRVLSRKGAGLDRVGFVGGSDTGNTSGEADWGKVDETGESMSSGGSI